jgi:hypothetical protein
MNTYMSFCGYFELNLLNIYRNKNNPNIIYIETQVTYLMFSICSHKSYGYRGI